MEETEKTVSRAIRFNESAWEDICRLAKSESMTPAAYVRIACNEKSERYRIQDELSDLEEQIQELKSLIKNQPEPEKVDLKPILKRLSVLKKDNEEFKDAIDTIWNRVNSSIFGRIF